MAEQTEQPPSPSSARTLTEALWFPVALFLCFLFAFAPALHAPQPHHAKVVVAHPAVERRIDSQLRRHHPGGFDVTAVTDGRAARQAVLNRDAVAGFVADRRHPVLYVAKANGMSLELALRDVFTEVAARSHKRLKVVDVAPTASKDLTGSTLVYFGIAWSVPGYMLATTLLRAVTFSRRRKLLTIAGVAALFSVVGNLLGAGLGYIPAAPSAMAISFLLTMAVATSSSGLAPFARQFFPAVGMGLFIVLSIPTSGGVAPAPMLPTFFQHVHAVMPLANAVDALRGALYFDGAGVLKPVLVLCAWIAGGAALLGLDAWLRSRRTTGRYADDEDEVEEPPVDDPASEMPTPTALPVHRHHFGEPIPTLVGTVHDSEHQPVRGAAVTVMDTKGRQLVRTTTDEHGEYAAAGLPEGYLRIVVSSVGRNPLVHQKLLRSGAIVRADFALRSRAVEVSQQAH
ncbi:carboxypeptidase regulatory-like domain-containing protein [Streptomyces sp. NRRL B-24720]|uniref:carboxypeptidase regulatory-like domain-containing protein n=1 Tax=Streptomyces sp. NRRL B-24720 TaxID=1476876 RepID=UPI0004C79A43|nr:carboxypeptidase regulatory-like domain-containing protein [Streptomyces sp. NRRL B-24720]